VVCVWSLIWGAVAVILHGSRRRRRQSVVRDRFGGECVSVVRTRSGESEWSGSLIWGKRKNPTDLGEKKKPSRASLSSHTGWPFITRASLSSHTGYGPACGQPVMQPVIFTGQIGRVRTGHGLKILTQPVPLITG